MLCEKYSYPLHIVKHAVAMNMDHQPSFHWWVTHMLKNHNIIITIAKNYSAWYLKQLNNLMMECPEPVEDELG